MIPPFQGEPHGGRFPRVETRLKPWAESCYPVGTSPLATSVTRWDEALAASVNRWPGPRAKSYRAILRRGRLGQCPH
jgi:hypothetical protein